MAPNGFSLGDVDYELKLLATLFTHKTINNEKKLILQENTNNEEKNPTAIINKSRMLAHSQLNRVKCDQK